MELRQIRSFLSVAETLHFGRTAEMIHLSQPALSLQIRALEDEIGVRPFERNRRKTVLTAAGVAFREYAAEVLSGLDQAVHKAKLAAKRVFEKSFTYTDYRRVVRIKTMSTSSTIQI